MSVEITVLPAVRSACSTSWTRQKHINRQQRATRAREVHGPLNVHKFTKRKNTMAKQRDNTEEVKSAHAPATAMVARLSVGRSIL